MTKYRGSNYRWSNLGGETGGKVDIYSTSLSQAISVKSAQTLSSVNPVGYFDQIYKGGIRDGIMVDGILTRFNKLKIDVVVPEGISQSAITAKLQDFYSKVSRRIELNQSLYPEIDYRNLDEVLDVNINFGYD